MFVQQGEHRRDGFQRGIAIERPLGHRILRERPPEHARKVREARRGRTLHDEFSISVHARMIRASEG
jgi:hypothetical protein